jgi:cell pole-organizing protein PopZ
MSSAQQASMEDILSSIRTSLEEETARVLQPDTQVAPADNLAEDVLDLASIDALVGDAQAAADPSEELIDLTAFASGAVQALGAGEAVKVDANPAGAPVALDLEDILNGVDAAGALAGVDAEQVVQAAPAADPIDSLLAELGGETAEQAPEGGGVGVDISADEVADIGAAPVLAAASTPMADRMDLQAFNTASGLQIGLPAEVLAAALRPMVGKWLADNLPAVVERLVKEEISKLTNQ